MSSMEEIALSGGKSMPAYLAVPDRADAARVPGLIVLHEIFGLNDDIRRIADRFAREGYAALAPDLYAGQGMRPFCILRTFLTLGRGEGPAFEAIERARAFLCERDEVDPSRIGIAGFCMGGSFALLFAARAPLGAAACFYGAVPATREELEGVCPVVAGFGGRDRLFAPGGRRLERILSDLGVDHDVVIYPDAGHSYMNRHAGWSSYLGAVSPMHVGYNAVAAEDSWRRMLSFFARRLGRECTEPAG